jgi:hypothetical protein
LRLELAFCGEAVSFVQVTVVPGEMVIEAGENPPAVIATATSPPPPPPPPPLGGVLVGVDPPPPPDVTVIVPVIVGVLLFLYGTVPAVLNVCEKLFPG